MMKTLTRTTKRKMKTARRTNNGQIPFRPEGR
jgi:hypothetical protein